MTDVGRPLRHIEQGASAADHDFRATDRFSAQHMFGPSLETEHVSWQKKVPDLAAAVCKHLVGADASGCDAIDEIRRFALTIDFCVSLKCHSSA
jgi:hypothetical protein